MRNANHQRAHQYEKNGQNPRALVSPKTLELIVGTSSSVSADNGKLGAYVGTVELSGTTTVITSQQDEWEMKRIRKKRITGAVLVALSISHAFAAATAFGQSSVKPLLTQPTEMLTISKGFRDWYGLAISGNTVVSGSANGSRGGLWAFDATSGKQKWWFRPSAPTSIYAHSLAPIDSGLAVAAFGYEDTGAFIAVSIATGKEVWRRASPAYRTGPAAYQGVFYMFASDGVLSAVDTAGKTKWSVPFGKNTSGRSTPAARDGAVYIIASLDTNDQYDRPASESFLFALDAVTGAEKWRYKHGTLEFLVTPEAIFSTTRDRSGYEYLIAVDRQTGRERWKPVDLSFVDDLNRKQVNPLQNLIEAGPYVVGSSRLGLVAFEKASGHMAWTLPCDPEGGLRPQAAAGSTLYFEGNAHGKSARWPSGTLHAMDVTSQKVIWSFRRERPEVEASWNFRDVLPIDGGLWAGAYKALVKLQ